ncbi:unnamed protein product, partial [Anisakis simplex]|uniref:Uncharacterized protein n=1 Tax=Anisakis simplex TaxID=6269 RepID=A0A0M3KI49_ANISI
MSAADGPSPSSDGHKSAADGLHVKTHRRVSSVFLPPQPPIIERTANAVSNSLTPLSNKLGLRSIILAKY